MSNNQKTSGYKVSAEHVVIDRDGVVTLNLERKQTKKQVWQLIKKFRDVKPSADRVSNPVAQT